MVTRAELEQRRLAAVKHGATAEAVIAPLARNARRRVLRQLRLSPRDLDPLARGYLDVYVRLASKVETIDRYVFEHGLIRDDGEPQPVMRLYVSLANGARLALSRLEEHLHKRADGEDALASYIEANYGEAGDGDA